jgi:hypothetical protein
MSLTRFGFCYRIKLTGLLPEDAESFLAVDTPKDGPAPEQTSNYDSD